MTFEWRPSMSQSPLGKCDLADLVDEDGVLRGFIFVNMNGRLAFVRFPTNMAEIHTPPVKDLEEMKAWAMAHVLLS